MRKDTNVRSVLAGLALATSSLLVAAVAVGDSREIPSDIASIPPPGSGVSTVDVAPSGNVSKDLGEPAGLSLRGSDHAQFVLTVEEITVVDECPGREVQLEPLNGHFVVLEISAVLSSDAATGASEKSFMPLVSDAFELMGSRGPVTAELATEAAWSCFGADELAAPFVGPGESTEGLIVLDSPIASGTLVYSPGAGSGWEWRFGP